MKRTVLAAMGVALLWMGRHGGNERVVAEAVVQDKQDAELPKLAQVFFGNKACSGTSCHGAPKPDIAAESVFTRHHEMTLWYELDKHKDATKVLTQGLGKEIAERLGIPVKTIDFVANKAQWKQCLTCHGVYVDDEDAVDKKTFAPAERLQSGVSCVACHGAHAEWVDEHTKTVKNVWQTFAREQKEEKFGLKDLWNAEQRALLCSSCHIGNAKEGKVVTHEMYAAGHPPLPGFEIATFSEAMPRHWETWPEKLKRLPKHKDLYAKAYKFNAEQEPDQIEQARMMMVSAAVGFRESMKLNAHLAADAGKEGRAWPELAAFDCYACHHDLRKDGWRQLRGYRGTPGRPQFRDWPLALLQVGIDHAARNAGQAKLDRAAFEKELQELIKVYNEQPFGAPPRVAQAAGKLAAWSDALVKRLQNAPYDRAAVERLLRAVSVSTHQKLVDFDSARQFAWALATLGKQAGGPSAKLVEEHYSDLDSQLNLQLPYGQKAIAGAFMARTMKLVQDYEPKKFQMSMPKFGELDRP